MGSLSSTKFFSTSFEVSKWGDYTTTFSIYPNFKVNAVLLTYPQNLVTTDYKEVVGSMGSTGVVVYALKTSSIHILGRVLFMDSDNYTHGIWAYQYQDDNIIKMNSSDTGAVEIKGYPINAPLGKGTYKVYCF